MLSKKIGRYSFFLRILIGIGLERQEAIETCIIVKNGLHMKL
jgi:hypothetical protein